MIGEEFTLGGERLRVVREVPIEIDDKPGAAVPLRYTAQFVETVREPAAELQEPAG